MLPLLKADGASRASVFYIAYVKQGETNTSHRPVTYCFNGGPGSSSVWLHLGALGPRRAKMNDDGTLPKPPFGLTTTNIPSFTSPTSSSSIPSPPASAAPPRTKKTINSSGNRGHRFRCRLHPALEHAPPAVALAKFLCGESYGVFRAAGLAEHLHTRYGMYVNGLILVSGVLDFATLNEGQGNDLPALVFLPAYTATAHFTRNCPPISRPICPRPAPKPAYSSSPNIPPRYSRAPRCPPINVPTSSQNLSASPAFPPRSSRTTTCAWTAPPSAKCSCATRA